MCMPVRWSCRSCKSFWEPSRCAFGEGRPALERYTTGLLTELPNKNCDTLAQAVPGSREQRLQEFLTNMQGDEEELNRQRVQKMIAEATRGDGVLVFDDTGFPKQGTASVGVARQYSGTLGQVGNCQVAVTCCYTDRQATGPVAVRLYLPKTWAQDPARRQQTRAPAEIPLQTKPEIALTLLEQARAWGVPHRCVVADADYRDKPNFLAGLEARQERYVVAVRADFQMSRGQAATSPVGRAAQRLQTVPRWQWRTMRWRHGTKGWLRKKLVGVRSWRVTGTDTRAGWSGSEPPGAGPRSGNISGATCPRTRPSKSWLAWPIGGMRSSSFMKRPRASWAGISSRDGCGRAFIGMP
jgi:SRSO17 transposase